MIGLMIADILGIKKILKMYILIGLVYIGIDIFSENSSMYAIVVLLGFMLVLSTFTYNEQCKWDTYVNTMPLRRSDIVREKYLLSILCVLTPAAVGMLTQFVLQMIRHETKPDPYIVIIAISLFAFLYLAIMMPILFKTGSEKARVIMVVLWVIPFLLIMLAKKADLIHESMITARQVKIFIISVVIVIIALFILSYFISKAIYQKKEL